ncbi:phosphopyruvate hydratase [Curtobacterium flaccumfaciens]|jgi:enolase|uniref:phosphopyruvate hydratase n=1 Tax=Curtobacterium flaccumfaciens TaxID=2035 RepID=UPI001BDE49CB|nr:phosphopyruvate hydratase [Curtobacterium flaccumfaciens]MBT1631662.1 phosphopyruvate hydratase [Curtobacterium flaccumfaciens pv. oortii]MCX2844175.1 phosphopyruvate hydratase [Curtobacterium flaccumfaciens pv. oortii]
MDIQNSDGSIDIAQIEARQVLDSRGYPTIAVRLTDVDGVTFDAAAPAGASTGAHEAVELRDGGFPFEGRGVSKAIAGANGEVADLLTKGPWARLEDLDSALAEFDGTGNYSRIGANTSVAVSIAAAHAFSHTAGLSLHAWIARMTDSAPLLPVPHFNVLNGGAHATNALAFQEFMIAPVGATSMREAVETGANVYHALKSVVKTRYGATGLGDEGGFAPSIENPDEALALLVEAIGTAGHTASLEDVAIALDPAANEFQAGRGRYSLDGRDLDREQLAAYYVDLLDRYPIRSIEDGFAEDDHEGWTLFASKVADRIQLVGDDLYVTDPARITDGAAQGYSNAVLIKPNQIGTVTQTFAAIAAARAAGMTAMISHRSGETLDTFIADLAVGTGVGQIKSGAPARGERVAKYNRLTDIEADNPALAFGLHP